MARYLPPGKHHLSATKTTLVLVGLLLLIIFWHEIITIAIWGGLLFAGIYLLLTYKKNKKGKRG